MQRVSPVDPSAASDDVKAIWEGVETLLGRVPNCWRVLAHSPDVARWLLPFCATLHRSGTGSVLDVRIKNLVALETSVTNQCAYCTSHNKSFGLGLGLTEEQVQVIDDGSYLESSLFDDRDKAALWWAEEVTKNTAKFNEDCFQNLKMHFSEPEIVEITLMGGLFALFNRFNDSLFIDIEDQDEVDRIRKTTVLPRAVVHGYAKDMAVEAGGSRGSGPVEVSATG